MLKRYEERELMTAFHASTTFVVVEEDETGNQIECLKAGTAFGIEAV